VRPFQKPLARMVIRGLAPNPDFELVSSFGYPGFANPDLFDQFPIRELPSHTSLADVRRNYVAFWLCSYSLRGISIIPFLRQNGPDDPRHFVCQRDRHQHPRLPRQHFA
jgi:hypothetical protein